jgi:hypothetical protein
MQYLTADIVVLFWVQRSNLSLERHPESVLFEDVFELLHMLDLIDEDLKALKEKSIQKQPDKDPNWQVGQHVDCNYESKGVWYPGRITGKQAGAGVEKFNIDYDDGDVEMNVELPRIRAPNQSTISSDGIVQRYKFCRRLCNQFKMVMDPDSDKGDLHMLQNWLTPEKEAHWIINSRRADADQSPLFLAHKSRSNDTEEDGVAHGASVEVLVQSKQSNNFADKIEALKLLQDEMKRSVEALSDLGFAEGVIMNQPLRDVITRWAEDLRPSTAQSADRDVTTYMDDEGTDERSIIPYPRKWSGPEYRNWQKKYADYDMATLEDLRSGLNLCEPKAHEKRSIDLASTEFQHMFDLARTFEALRRSGHLNYGTYDFGFNSNNPHNPLSRKQDRKLVRDDMMDDVHHVLAKLWRANEDEKPLTERLLTEEEVPKEPKERRLKAYDAAYNEVCRGAGDKLKNCSSLEELQQEFRKEPMKKFYVKNEAKDHLDEKQKELKEWRQDVTKLKAKHYFLNFLSLSQVTRNPVNKIGRLISPSPPLPPPPPHPCTSTSSSAAARFVGAHASAVALGRRRRIQQGNACGVTFILPMEWIRNF